MFQKLTLFAFMGKEAPNLVKPLRMSYCQSLGTTETVTC